MTKTLLPLLLAFIAIVGCAHTPDPKASTEGYIGKEDSTWKAWTNDMPPGPRSLHVVGGVTVANGRYGALIKLSDETPGVHCLVEVVDKGGMGTTALTSREVHLIESNYDGTDPQVTVHFPDSTTLDIPIESAQ